VWFLKQKILDFLFPVHCINCQAKNVYLCPNCLNKIPILNQEIYSTSSLPNLTKQANGLKKIIAVCDYRASPILQQSLHLFKYRRIKELGKILGKNLIKPVADKFLEQNKQKWLLIPIPLHQRKKLKRGFNQNDILAQAGFGAFSPKKIKILDQNTNPIKRIKFTKTQTKLTGKQRLKNVKSAFKIINKKIIKDQNIILLDDVLTTGATLSNASACLYQAGAKKIYSLVLAKD